MPQGRRCGVNPLREGEERGGRVSRSRRNDHSNRACPFNNSAPQWERGAPTPQQQVRTRAAAGSGGGGGGGRACGRRGRAGGWRHRCVQRHAAKGVVGFTAVLLPHDGRCGEGEAARGVHGRAAGAAEGRAPAGWGGCQRRQRLLGGVRSPGRGHLCRLCVNGGNAHSAPGAARGGHSGQHRTTNAHNDHQGGPAHAHVGCPERARLSSNPCTAAESRRHTAIAALVGHMSLHVSAGGQQEA